MKIALILTSLFLMLWRLVAEAAPTDLLVGDFEGTNYGAWKATGQAFGPGPAHGTLPGQMPVEGFQGHGLVNSFFNGDDSVGTLTSPPFKLERRYVSFLIGGGGFAGKTCMNLLIDGKVVRTATGPNTAPGGTERLDWQQWEIPDFAGREASIEIVDRATGSWGHINVDQIVQTDQKLPELRTNVTREIIAEKAFLNLPIKNGAPKRRMSLRVDGKSEREFDLELADAEPEWWAFLDLTPFRGKRVVLNVDQLPEDSRAVSSIEQADQIKNSKDLYHEKFRPQFHFSARRGWNNDPNGLVFYQGEYHLFFQHNPYGWSWGNMHWGHAVSPDLVHWKELPIALYPDEHGTMFSGSAIVDWQNTAGFQNGSEKVLVCIFTAAGKPFTQGIAYSNDRGSTWQKYESNPVLPHIRAENRDPKVIWFSPQNKWVMALYLDQNDYELLSSSDLKHWNTLSPVVLSGASECPEFFPISVMGSPGETRWIFYGGNGRYLVGAFDGTNFTTESGPHVLHAGNSWYASQTYNDIPSSDGRRILVPWGTMATPGMPFNQMMGTPVELTLRRTDEGLRLFANPIRELGSLITKSQEIKSQTLSPGQNPLTGIEAELLDLNTDVTLGQTTELGFNLRGVPIVYDVAKAELSCNNEKASLKPEAGKLRLHFLVDRTTIDIFGNGGQLYMTVGVLVAPEDRSLAVYVKGGEARINSLQVRELKSSWQ